MAVLFSVWAGVKLRPGNKQDEQHFDRQVRFSAVQLKTPKDVVLEISDRTVIQEKGQDWGYKLGCHQHMDFIKSPDTGWAPQSSKDEKEVNSREFSFRGSMLWGLEDEEKAEFF